MANITDIERLNYYEGEFLGAQDFQTEQDYHRDMRRRHNVGQHTWGIVSGLDLVQIPNNTNAPDGKPAVDIYVQPGMAVDAFGREIIALTKTQLTQDLFSPYVDMNNPGSQPMYIWISYAQLMLQPPADPCARANQPNAFGRVQEAFALTVTKDSTGPTNDLIIVDGKAVAPPAQTGDIVFPADDSIPYQEFSTDDSAVTWYILLGQVLWYPASGVFEQTDDSTAATGREYAGNVSSTIFSPDNSLRIQNRFAPYPLPQDPSDKTIGKYYGGVSVQLAGSLSLDRRLEVAQNVLIDGAADLLNVKAGLSPLNINAGLTSKTEQDFIQLRDPGGVEKWLICQNLAGTYPGLHLGEIATPGPGPGNTRMFIQSKISGGTPPPPSPLNVGIGTLSPRNPLAVRAQGAWEELLSFEDATAKTNWHINQNPQGVNASRGLNFSETGVADFRLFLQTGGNVGIGTGAPVANLDVRGQASFQGALSINHAGVTGVGSPGDTRAAITFGATDTPAAFYFGAYDANTGRANTVLGLFSYQFNNWIQVWTPDGKVGVGTQSPGATLDVGNGLLHVAGTTTPAVPAQGAYLGWNALTGGTGETDFINNQGLGTGGFAFMNTPPSGSPISTLVVITGSGKVGIATSTPTYTLEVNGTLGVGNTLTVNGSRTYLIGQDGANLHWIMGGGTTETVNNALGLSFDSGSNTGSITVGGNWTLVAAQKIGYLADRFINRGKHKLERGDVVVLHSNPGPHHTGLDRRVPLPEVDLTTKAKDTRVCGIVDDPSANPTLLNDLDPGKLGDVSVGVMVTAGAFSYCKVDADAESISPGDLLTTSSTPGHAQTLGAHETAGPGAIIGKALGSLKKGKGMIPIIVSHQ
jgi:hypothetical protein